MLFLQTYPVAIPFLTLLAAEAVKAFIDVIHKRGKIRFVKPGGMPSGHTAVVSALVVTVAYRETIESTAFMISAALALIVMYDAVNLRNQAGLHAKAINKLNSGTHLEESLGHTLGEVIVGAVFGAVVAILLLNI